MQGTATIDQFIADLGITMKATRVDHNPNWQGSDERHMDHWHCVLSSHITRITTYFSMGMGHNGREPGAAEVLSTLADDVASYENAGSFEEWCSEFGYNTDSRRAERMYKAIERQSDQLKRLVGHQYNHLLWDVARDD